MVTSAPTKRTPATRSTVALKYSMAVSGLIMIGYLLLHMYGNLKVFAGQEAFDEYAHHLRTFGEPMLPYEGLLWIVRVVLLAAILVHIYAVVVLTIRNRRAAGYAGGKRYHSKQNRTGIQRSYASFTLRWGGVVILAFIVYHLLHLTAQVVTPGGASDSPYDRVVNGFEIWYVTVGYTVAMLAVGLHLWHGIWSALTSLGGNRSATRIDSRLTGIAVVVTLVIVIGFLLPPWAIFLGLEA
ncbi:succinate dehydrogenase cytochrome b subunit [Aeromicrobium sp. Leaf350]|uniref:succinate dehydrogenase cytochrome b subunit n=1 Tax=Aeromicrobium sp. Leaf350 TaxID=2876565 RepID=UPI001E30D280|nr:succinate dehydrogenase cytochrome b subunit [Aeromicrobium sp. Leaf350]